MTKPPCERSHASSRIWRVSTSLPAASSATAATVRVDCGAPLGPLRRLWTSFGYDEINWTSTPTGKRHLRTIREFAEQPYYVRSHYVFNSGIGWSLPHWGSRQRLPRGRRRRGRSTTSPSPTRCTTRSCRPGTARWWSWRSPRARWCRRMPRSGFAFEPSPTQWSPYEAGLWAMPPKDYDKWGGLVRALVEHCVERYGAASRARAGSGSCGTSPTSPTGAAPPSNSTRCTTSRRRR